MVNFLDQPQSEKWLAAKVNVPAAQRKDWLGRAVREGRVKKLKKPVRYVAASGVLFAL
jgi:hypothetical protein